MNFNERVAKATKLMEAEGLNALLITRPYESRSLFYLTGIDRFCANLLIFRDGKSSLLVLDQDLLDAKETAYADRIITYASTKSQFEAIANLLKEYELTDGIIGVEKAFLHQSYYESLSEVLPRTLKITDASKVTGQLRLIKTNDEIELIKRASEIASKVLETTAEAVRPGISENEISAIIEYELRREGAESNATATLVSSGSRTKAAHPPPSTRILEKRDIVTVDLHPRFKGYCSDIAATFTIDSKESQLMDKINQVLEARDRSINATRVSDKFSTITLRYLQNLHKSGFSIPTVPFFNILHGIGVSANDPPSFWYPSDIEIQPGMVFAFTQTSAQPKESQEIGIKFEDTYLATSSGIKKLTSFNF